MIHEFSVNFRNSYNILKHTNFNFSLLSFFLRLFFSSLLINIRNHLIRIIHINKAPNTFTIIFNISPQSILLLQKHSTISLYNFPVPFINLLISVFGHFTISLTIGFKNHNYTVILLPWILKYYFCTEFVTWWGIFNWHFWALWCHRF